LAGPFGYQGLTGSVVVVLDFAPRSGLGFLSMTDIPSGGQNPPLQKLRAIWGKLPLVTQELILAAIAVATIGPPLHAFVNKPITEAEIAHMRCAMISLKANPGVMPKC
jgi:hypothetical protein